jgi:broad specificity phosphatase PhoE
MLLGRAIDAPLDAHGFAQAGAVAEHLANVANPILECSPRRRARQTAEQIGRRLEISAQAVPALDELDFGPWAGRSFADLEQDAQWQLWNSRRSQASTPAGESIARVYERASGYLAQLRRAHPHSTLILVTHAEVIRTLVMSWLGLSPDGFAEVHIAPASMTRVAFDSDQPRIEELNMQVAA